MEWEARNKLTGEIVELDVLAIRDGGNFEKTYVKELALLIGCTGDSQNKVLSYLLRNKNSKNEVQGTQREIANCAGVSISTVIKVFKALSEGNYLKLKRSGLYILNPDVMHYGGLGNKIAILKIFKDCK